MKIRTRSKILFPCLILISDHYISTLHCKQACPKKLDYVSGEFKDDYLAEHYNYLQYAYYKGKLLLFYINTVI